MDIWASVKGPSLKGRSLKGRSVEWDVEVDCLGLLCPLPVLRARRVLAGMQAGAVLRVLASDAMAGIDLPHFCVQAGHEFLGQTPVQQEGAVQGLAYLIRCGGARDL